MSEKVLVTGGTGFLALELISQLLQQGYDVKTTVRSLSKQEQVLQIMSDNKINNLDHLSFIEADLNSDRNWAEAMSDRQYVFSVASPIFFGKQTDEATAMKPAVDGIKRILKFSQPNIKRVVMTGNFGAVGFSHMDHRQPVTERDWTAVDQRGLSLYEKSKLMAEKAAWEIISQPTNTVEFATINPGAILGPAISTHITGSFGLINNLLSGSMNRIPDMPVNIVDVRDVAALHIKAMFTPDADGKRFIAVASEATSLPQIAQILRDKRPEVSQKITTKPLPDLIIKIGTLFNEQAREARLFQTVNHHVSTAQAQKILGWTPQYSVEETITQSVDSLVKFDLVQKK